MVVSRLRLGHCALNYGLAMVDKQIFFFFLLKSIISTKDYETIKAVIKQLKAVRSKGYNPLSGVLQVN